MFVDFFIRRPIFATVCALLIVLAGAVCIPTLPISLYPQLAPPQVIVTCNYVGANAQRSSSPPSPSPLEQSINGVEGMRYISSTSSNDGTSAITVTFHTGYDLNIAAVDVQNRVASAQGRLPAAVNNTGITITKANSNFVLAAGFISPDNSLSTSLHLQLPRRLRRDALKRVPGVGDVIIFGERKYAMRVWLDPAKLAARASPRSTSPTPSQSRTSKSPPASSASRPPTPSQNFQMAVRVVGRLSDPQQFENIILKNAGHRRQPVSSCSRTSATPRSAPKTTPPLSSSPAATPSASASSSSPTPTRSTSTSSCRAVLAELEKSFPPGLKYIIAVDTTTVVSDSIREVVRTLAEAIVIVIIVIFLFLQDWRATIIPAVTIPVSLIGTFAFIKIFGFSINSLTLFGITLATGLVVDDAIVVIENVQRHICRRRRRPARGHQRRHGRGHQRRHRHLARAHLRLHPGQLLPRHHRHSLQAVLAHHRLLHRHLGLQRAHPLARARRHPAAPGAAQRPASWACCSTRSTAASSGSSALVRRRRHLRRRASATSCWSSSSPASPRPPTCTTTSPPPSSRRKTRATSSSSCRRPPAPRSATPPSSPTASPPSSARMTDVFGTFSVMGFSLSGGSSPELRPHLRPAQAHRRPHQAGPGPHRARHRRPTSRPKLFGVPGGIAFAAEPPAIPGIGTVGGFQFILQDAGRNTFGDIDRVAHTMVGQARAPGTSSPA